MQVEGHPEALFEWVDEAAWRISGVVLAEGENQLRVVGVDASGAEVESALATVNKIGNAAPVASLRADPDWLVPLAQSLEVRADESRDPEGGTLSFQWTMSPDLGEAASVSGDRVEARFFRPGHYAFSVSAADSAGATGEARREATVYGPGGFSNFGGRALDGVWELAHAAPIGNTLGSAAYWLDKEEGELVLRVDASEARPLDRSAPVYPAARRALPRTQEWTFESEFVLRDRQFGLFHAGIEVELGTETNRRRFVFGSQNGSSLTVAEVAPDGASSTLARLPLSLSEHNLRVRQSGETAWFERRVDDQWTAVESVAVAPDATGRTAGLFVSTEAPQTVEVGFDFAVLVDPTQTSSLRGNVTVSEIMYGPLGGGDFEFLELLNAGDAAVDLTGARFTDGIDYQFGAQSLLGGARLVIVKDRTAFLSRYGAEGVLIAAGEYSGSLRNEGETLEMVDAENRLVFSVTYDNGGEWPSRPQGMGSSLEAKAPGLDLNDPDSWRSSAEYLGSPGRPGVGRPASVVINEVLSHTDPPLEDAIELYNPTAAAIDIGGWFLSDDLAELDKYRVPFGTVVPANGYHVVYEQQFLLSNPRTPFSLNSFLGDVVRLTSANAAGDLELFVDNVRFDASANGVSFGRFPNGVGPLTAMAAPTFGADVAASDPPELLAVFRLGRGAENAGPRVGPVVISEILYDPAAGEDEFVRLTNISSEETALFDPEHPENVWRLDDAITFAFPEGIALAAGDSLYVVSESPAAFRARQGVADGVPVLGPYAGRLNNGGETIRLFRPDPPQTAPPNEGLVPQILADSVSYDDAAPWPAPPDGGGISLKRVNLAGFGDDPLNWSFEEPPVDADADQDGLPDAYELANGLDPTNPADAREDADQDGMTNLEEFLAGTDPRQSADALRFSEILSDGGQVRLAFEARAGRRYELLGADSLSAGVWSVVATIAEGDARVVEAIDALSSEDAVRFYRIRLAP